MLKQQPAVQEKEDAVDFQYRAGGIQFQNLGYTHYILDSSKPEVGEKKAKKPAESAAAETRGGKAAFPELQLNNRTGNYQRNRRPKWLRQDNPVEPAVQNLRPIRR